MKTNRKERVDEINNVSSSLYVFFFQMLVIKNYVTLTVFFLCTILSSFLAMRSTSWSFAMFTGLGPFDGARWTCLHLCVKMRPSLCVCVCLF